MSFTKLFSRKSGSSACTSQPHRTFLLLCCLGVMFILAKPAWTQGGAISEALRGLMKIISVGKRAESIEQLMEQITRIRKATNASRETYAQRDALMRHAEALARRDPAFREVAKVEEEFTKIQRLKRKAEEELHSLRNAHGPEASTRKDDLLHEINLLSDMEPVARIRWLTAKTHDANPAQVDKLLTQEKTRLTQALKAASPQETPELFQQLRVIKDLQDIHSGSVAKQLGENPTLAISRARQRVDRLIQEQSALEENEAATTARKLAKGNQVREAERKLHLLESEAYESTAFMHAP